MYNVDCKMYIHVVCKSVYMIYLHKSQFWGCLLGLTVYYVQGYYCTNNTAGCTTTCRKGQILLVDPR